MTGAEWSDVACRTDDGLTLHARNYAASAPSPSDAPVLCLPGLTRNARDFHDLARALSDRWRVIACDYRGRGRSDYDPDPANYSPIVETADVLKLLDHLDLQRMHVIGTSRGGIIAMLMATVRPGLILSACLNDVGPRIEPEGLARIAGYVTRDRTTETWPDAIAALKSIHGPTFPGMSDGEWEAFAQCIFRDEDGRPVADYDPALKSIFTDNPDASRGVVPELWEQYDALAASPVLVIRGENSDLLSAETVDLMVSRSPQCSAVTVRDRGHAPFLNEPESVAAIRSHLDHSEHTTD